MTNTDPVDVRKLLAPLPVKESRVSRAVRRINLPSRLVAGMIAVVVVVGIVIIPYLAVFGVDFPSKFQAVDTVKTFCGAETDGKYDAAYGLLSARIQRRMSVDDLQRASKAARFGGCGLAKSGFTLKVSGATTRVPMECDNVPGGGASGGTTQGTMTLVRESGGWRI